MDPKYQIRIQGGSPEQNEKWSKEISKMATAVEAEFQKLKRLKISNWNEMQIRAAMEEKRRS